ncbi:hypothetical protein F2Q68_00031944 [Brassica cretica]|uniref:Uncharacterized protein n=1 Tax=Brassica cretica TaxID=69181 RepID=A0A8S9G6C8_BRACR|nr:hypothetical protein F2Q68_00031944 [Brassica cretica]
MHARHDPALLDPAWKLRNRHRESSHQSPRGRAVSSSQSGSRLTVGIQIRRREARELLLGVVLSDRGFLLRRLATSSNSGSAKRKLSILSNGGFFHFAQQVLELLVRYKRAHNFVNCRNILTLAPKLLIVHFNPTEFLHLQSRSLDSRLLSLLTEKYLTCNNNLPMLPKTSKCAFQPL